MSIFKRRPKEISGDNRSVKLFQTDDDYIQSRVKAGGYKNTATAIRMYVNLGVRVERQTELGKDETMYAVVKKQETVVLEGTRPLVAAVQLLNGDVRATMGRQDETILALAQQLERLTAQVERQSLVLNRLLEISVICYGILRHYVLGLFVVRLTKTPFATYAAGFAKRLDIFRKSVRASNLLLEGDYEQAAEEFARALAEATSVKMPANNGEQLAQQTVVAPVLDNRALNVPTNFPAE